MTHVLVIGIPRSGTTWVGTLLGRTKDATYLEEPDNHLMYPFACRAKRALGCRFYPALGPGGGERDYERLWRAAFGLELHESHRFLEAPRRAIARALWTRVANEAIRRALLAQGGVPVGLRAAEALAVPEEADTPAQHVVVKSVFAPLSVDWIASRFPVSVVVVLRDVLNVLSSWVQLEWVGRRGDDMLDSLDPVVRDRLGARYAVPAPGRDAPLLARGAWLLAALTRELDEAAKQHPEWEVVRHEDLCRQPHDLFPALAARVGLEWTSDTSRLLDDLNRSGSGVSRARIASELPEVWRGRLRPHELRDIEPVLERFAVAG